MSICPISLLAPRFKSSTDVKYGCGLKQSRRREAATAGESRIPLDRETERCVQEAGFSMDDILPYGDYLTVRKTANLHTGGTIHDVTAKLHPTVVQAAIRAAAAFAWRNHCHAIRTCPNISM